MPPKKTSKAAKIAAPKESGYVCEEMKEQFVKMNKDAVNMLGSIMRSTSTNKALSMRLKKNWEDNGIIEIDAQYEEVEANKLLMKTMLKHLANGLPTKLDKSNFGLGYVTDHGLYFNGATDKLLSEYLHRNLIALDHDEFIKLSKSRNKLFTMVRSTRRSISLPPP